jgi:low affinity Fe/Cu permease
LTGKDGGMTKAAPAQLTTRLGALTGHPAAFLIVLAYGALWFSFSRDTFDWIAVATLVIWCMTLFIQRADRRDTLAVHAKLDELLKATREARTELAQIDEEEPEDIEKIRDREKREVTAERPERGHTSRPQARPD